MRIAVTGVAGFMGSHLADWLIGLGHEIYGCDDFSGGFQHNVPAKCKFHYLDLRRIEDVCTWMKVVRPQIVYHLAADATEGRSQFTPISATHRNYVAYLNVLVTAIRHGVKRIVFTSSMSVYGKQKPPFTESMPRSPVDIYGIAKASCEAATEVMADVHGIEYTIIRPHNVYGPRQRLDDPYRNVVGIFIRRALSGQPLYIYGDGEQRRAFSFIDDVTPLIGMAGFLPQAKNRIINVGNDTHYSINELADTIQRVLGREVKREYVPDRPREVKRAWCDHTVGKRIFGKLWHNTPLEEGIAHTIVWAERVMAEDSFASTPRYLPALEVGQDKAPVTWRKQLL